MKSLPWRATAGAFVVSLIVCAYILYVYVRPTRSIEITVDRGARVWLGDELLGEDGCHRLIPFDHPELILIQDFHYSWTDVAEKTARALAERGGNESHSGVQVLVEGDSSASSLGVDMGDRSVVCLIERGDRTYDCGVCQVCWMEGDTFLLLLLHLRSPAGDQIPFSVKTRLHPFEDWVADDFRGLIQKLLGCPDRIAVTHVQVRSWTSIDEMIREERLPGPASRYSLRRHVEFAKEE